MKHCNCSSSLASLNELCESCRAEYLQISEQAELEDKLANLYGCNPESLILISEAEAHALAAASAQDRYEPSDPAEKAHARIDIHARKIADLERRLDAQAETIRTLHTCVSALVGVAVSGKAAA